MAMDIRNWCSSGATRSLCVGRGYTELELVDASATTRSRRSTWKLLWRKMLKEKRKVFENSCLGHGEKFPYDECSYAQNFDEGNLMWDEEPDGLSRSFSVRFSDPSRSRNAFLNKLK